MILWRPCAHFQGSFFESSGFEISACLSSCRAVPFFYVRQSSEDLAYLLLLHVLRRSVFWCGEANRVASLL